MKKEKWIEIRKAADFRTIGETYHVDPVIARIARNRENITDEQFRAYFCPDAHDILSPYLLKGAKEAAALLNNMIDEGKRIRIIGDYDIDGICATYILYHGLSKLGASIDYELPHRIEDGYGLNEKLIRQAHGDGCEVILTCDNGIAAFDEIKLAKELGMCVIVTDHHEIPLRPGEDGLCRRMPPADAVVDPKQEGETYPWKDICGAVVAWKVLMIVQKLRGENERWDDYLEFAAIATIGDVMILQGENRAIVALGLERLRNTNHIGLSALIEQNGLDRQEIRAYHVGFVIGPCMNASGRLDTAKRALKLLLTNDIATAIPLAADLVALNTARKELTAQGLEQAIELVESRELYRNQVLTVYLPECHESLAGIIAGKLRERYYRPCFVLTNARDCIKGSGRSIPGYSMFEKLSMVGDLFLKFGGHPMAAGISLESGKLEAFQSAINEGAMLTEEQLTEKIYIDVAMPLEYITTEFVQQLSVLEPCGNGNEKPVFAAKNLHAKRAYYIGRERKMLKLSVKLSNGSCMDALYFGDAEEFLNYYREKYGKEKVDALMNGQKQEIPFAFTYYPNINEYQGTQSLQIVITHFC
ncbi:MAG: single-stranded-DNA-specific exonuclease RecJ [bacterium]|nr:single-stranded-DNA-specific exonuclease RecJ [bacterium]